MIQPPKSSLMSGTLSSRQGTAKTQHVRPKKSLSSSESKGSTFGDELQLKVFRCYAFEVKKRSRSQTFQNTWFLMRDSAFFSQFCLSLVILRSTHTAGWSKLGVTNTVESVESNHDSSDHQIYCRYTIWKVNATALMYSPGPQRI